MFKNILIFARLLKISFPKYMIRGRFGEGDAFLSGIDHLDNQRVL